MNNRLAIRVLLYFFISFPAKQDVFWQKDYTILFASDKLFLLTFVD
jgi:hypothetical protein